MSTAVQKCPLDIIYDRLSDEYKTTISTTLNIGTHNHNAINKPHLSNWSGSLTRHLKAKIASKYRIEGQYTAAYRSVNTDAQKGYPISTEFGIAYIGSLELHLYMLCESRNESNWAKTANPNLNLPDEHSLKKYLIDTVVLPVHQNNILPAKAHVNGQPVALDILHTQSLVTEFADRANAIARGEFIFKPIQFSAQRRIHSRVQFAKVLKIAGMNSVGRLFEDLTDPSLKPMFLVEIKVPKVFIDQLADRAVLATDGKLHYLARRMITKYVCVENKNYVDFSDYYDGNTIVSAIEQYTSDMKIN